MKNELAKDQVIETITDILIDTVGWIKRDEISPTADLTRDIYIDSDDLSFFAEEVIKHFGIEPTQEEWSLVETIEQTAELVIKHSKDRVIETLIDILIDVIGWIERDEISPSKDLLRDMHIVDDDLTIFDMEVVKHFGIRPTFEEWYQTGTIEKVADLVLEHLLKSDDSMNDPNKSIPANASSGKRPLISQEFTECLARSVGCLASWVVGLVILGFLVAYTDWPLALIIIPVVLWIFCIVADFAYPLAAVTLFIDYYLIEQSRTQQKNHLSLVPTQRVGTERKIVAMRNK